MHPSFFPRPANRSLVLRALAATLVLTTLSGITRADELSEVTRLHRAGQTSAALQRAEQFLAGKPDDTQMRFLRGVLLADSQRNAEAMAVFAKLALDHPELAEAHNNVATLYAAASDYDKARLALEQAIRANPDYATAHENLGDVYAMLANQSYARAARLDRGNTGIAPKLALVRELFKTSKSPGTSRTNSSQ